MKKIICVLVVMLLLSACNKKEGEQQDSDKQTIIDVDRQSKIEETIKEEDVIEEEIDDGAAAQGRHFLDVAAADLGEALGPLQDRLHLGAAELLDRQ